MGSTEYKTTTDFTDTADVRVTDYQWESARSWVPRGDPNAGSGLAFVRGGSGYGVNLDKTKTTQARVDLSWFVGNHNMKFGLSQLTSKYTEVAATSGGERVTINASSSGAPTLPNGLNRQFLHTNATVKAIINAVYAQDTWDVGAGVKLMYGFRFETQDQRDLHDKSFMKFDKFSDYVQPRLGFTWDVNQDGKTKVSGNYAEYFEQIPQRMAIRVYANETYLRYNYRRANSTYDNATGAYTYGATPNSIVDYATPFSFDPIAENVKLPQRTEYILGVDHTFASGWTAGIHAKYRELKNPMEDMVFTDQYGNPYDEGPAISFTGSGSPNYGAGAAVIGNPGGFQQWRPNPLSMTNVILAGGAGSTNYAGYPYPYNNYGINILDYYNPATGLFTVADTGFPKAGNRVLQRGLHPGQEDRSRDLQLQLHLEPSGRQLRGRGLQLQRPGGRQHHRQLRLLPLPGLGPAAQRPHPRGQGLRQPPLRPGRWRPQRGLQLDLPERHAQQRLG